MSIINALLWLSIGCALLGYSLGAYLSSFLPPENSLFEDIEQSPLQAPSTAPPFHFTHMDEEYTVYPKANYEIWGLVVSHNDILAWWDIYHDKKSVDIKDICLIWGPNTDEDVYQSMSFWNESVSCHVKNRLPLPAGKYFSNNAFSNNHLLTGNPLIQEQIKQIRVGDQIYMKGFLVDYHNRRTPDLVRKTSLARNDTAGFACEVMYVTELDVLQKAPRLWHKVYEYSKQWLLPLLALKFFTFLLFSWLKFKLT